MRYFEEGYHKEGDIPFSFPPPGVTNEIEGNIVEISGRNGTGSCSTTTLTSEVRCIALRGSKPNGTDLGSKVHHKPTPGTSLGLRGVGEMGRGGVREMGHWGVGAKNDKSQCPISPTLQRSISPTLQRSISL